MNEADYKRRLVAQVKAIGGWARRWEDRHATGVLDLIILMRGYRTVWAEGKLIDGNLFGPTPRQFVEGKMIQDAGGYVFLLGWKKGQMYVSRWVEQADYRKGCFTLEKTDDVHILQSYMEVGRYR